MTGASIQMTHLNRIISKSLFAAALLVIALPVVAQVPASYGTLIQEGNAQLQALDAEAARKTGETAIHTDANRWEGYALEGGALMNLKRYEEAADTLSEAIKRAPESKQPTLRDLRRQCLLADSGAPGVVNTPIAANTTSQAEIVLWKSIENSASPADFQSYLYQYPSGAFAVLANQHLDQLHEASAKRAEMEAAANERRTRDAVWTDDSTGLMWTRIQVGPIIGNGLGGEPERDAALQVCAKFNALHYTNWRLPTVAEVKTITSSGFMAVRKIRSEFSIAPRVDGIYVSDLYWKGSTVPIRGLSRDGYAPICVRDAK
jgi:tetratricopeptide (TPR) repeat protein